MNISADQLKIICGKVERSRVVIATLKDDLIDHLCCEVEARMESGSSFDDSLEEALQEVAPEGLFEIQRQTDLLLNSKKIHMKKLIYVVGLLSTMSCSSGFFFKILHLPGGDQLLSFGFLGFVLLFLPLTSFGYFKVNMGKSVIEKTKFILGTISGLVAGLGVLFKLLHLVGADQLLVAGAIVFTLAYLPVMFFDMYLQSETNRQSTNTGSIS